MENIDLRSKVQEFVARIRQTFPENITIRVIDEGADLIIKADVMRIQQALMNIALNSRDAMSDGGLLSFRLARVKFDTRQPPPIQIMEPGSWALLEVVDTRAGIIREDLHHFVEPSFSTKDIGEEKGAGMSQVREFVKYHNGHIKLTRAVGEGTNLRIYFPIIFTETARISYTETESIKVGNQETILIVEDDQAVLRATSEVLENLNYQVLTASSGVEALEVYRRENVDLVLSDLVMPEMGGIDLYKAIREKNQRVKVLMMTGYPLGGGTRELLENGSVTWFQKPVDMERLSQKVRDALTGRNRQQ